MVKKAFLLLIIICFNVKAQSQNIPSVNALGDNYSIKSDILKEDRQIQIFTPESYSKADKINQLMQLYQEAGKFNGSVLVAEKGEVIYKRGLGLANMEWNISNQPNTKHRIASITKQFTALLIMQLVEQGKLKLNSPIITYIPDYPKASGNQITVHHLLTHTSGIPNFRAFKIFNEISKTKHTPKEIVSVFKDSTLQFVPGEKFSYSNSGYTLLGVIIENITGKTFEQNLQESIFTPLKMNNSGYDHHDTILEHRSSGYVRHGSGYKNADYIDMSIPYAAGSIYSTVEDLYLWDQALYSDKLLSLEYRELMYSKYTSAGPWHYGYGWIIKEDAKGALDETLRVLEHNGGVNGYNTLISRIPLDKHLIVLINNTGKSPLDEINVAIRNILYDKSYQLPKLSTAFLILKEIKTNGIEAGLEKFEVYRKSDKYNIDESEMNTIGYELIKFGFNKEAIIIFKINTEVFTKSSNAYDSLAETYALIGMNTEALKNYEIALKLNPSNSNAKNQIKKLKKRLKN
jgi:CubicO group peptidase (beta-lactamase class C family)